jgi:hypothetical protein
MVNIFQALVNFQPRRPGQVPKGCQQLLFEPRLDFEASTLLMMEVVKLSKEYTYNEKKAHSMVDKNLWPDRCPQ